MAKYRFEEFAINSTAKKKPVEEDKYTYLGLEHLDPGTLKVTRFGSEVAPIGEKLIMKKGDVLFGKRRAYQKKVAIAPFDGIFSAHGMVLRPNEEVMDKDFFPLFISSDYFLDAAIKISVGSLSPTINWSDLKVLEFELPSLEEQPKLAKVLWAMNDTIESYKKLIRMTDELVKSQFIEMFSETSVQSHGWTEKTLDSIVEKPISGEWGKDDPTGTGIKVLRTTNFTDLGVINYSDVATRIIDAKKAAAKYMKHGDVLIEKSGGSDTKPVGRVVLYDGEDDQYLFNNFTSVLRLKPTSELLPVFLFKFLYVNYWNDGTRLYENKTTGIHNLKLADYLAGTSIPLPPLELQHQFAAFVQQSDKSKFKLEQALAELTATYKGIIAENLR
jgi:type I restriction enzyme S subunit